MRASRERLHAALAARKQLARDVRREMRTRCNLRSSVQAGGRKRARRIARDLRSERHPKPACPPCHRLDACVRRTQQRHEQQRLAFIQSRRLLAEESARRRADAGQLSAEHCEVQIRLENLRLRPRALDLPRRAHLAPLLRGAAPPAGRLERGIDLRRELHRDRASTALRGGKRVLPCARSEREPIHAAVIVEAPILRLNQRAHQHRRDLIERRPRQYAPPVVDSEYVDHLAVAVEQHAFGYRIRCAHFVETRQHSLRERHARDQTGEEQARSQGSSRRRRQRMTHSVPSNSKAIDTEHREISGEH